MDSINLFSRVKSISFHLIDLYLPVASDHSKQNSTPTRVLKTGRKIAWLAYKLSYYTRATLPKQLWLSLITWHNNTLIYLVLLTTTKQNHFTNRCYSQAILTPFCSPLLSFVRTDHQTPSHLLHSHLRQMYCFIPLVCVFQLSFRYYLISKYCYKATHTYSLPSRAARPPAPPLLSLPEKCPTIFLMVVLSTHLFSS